MKAFQINATYSLQLLVSSLCFVSMNVSSNPEYELCHTLLIILHPRFHLIMNWCSLLIVPNNKLLYFVITEMYF